LIGEIWCQVVDVDVGGGEWRDVGADWCVMMSCGC